MLIVISALSLNGCLGKAPEAANGGTTLPSVSVNVPPTAFQNRLYSIDFSASQISTVTGVTVSGGPSWLTYNSGTFKLAGTPTEGAANFPTMQMSVTFADGSTQSMGPYSVSVVGDPLKQYQWNLKNTGQNVFSTSNGVAGYDINIDPVHSSGSVGSSTIWLVVSDGRIDISHEDLSPNSDASLSKNYTLASPYYGNPTSTDDADFHGTAVASIMAAAGWNNLGIRGVCPSCKLIGYNFLDSDGTVSKLINQAASGSVAVYNYSYGAGTCQVTPVDSSYIAQVRTTAQTGRGGKGSIFVTSAGNDFVGPQSSPCNFVYLGNSNLDQFKSYPYVIVTGAIDASGMATTYSTPGSNTWVVAPGGEDFGQTKPALIGADLEGCTKGQAKTSATENAFESNSNGLNANCKYTSAATGTSFASPTVAGLAGILLSANPNLSWRDVKHILASTATQIQPSAGNTTHPMGYDLVGHTYQQGWVTNAAGYKFHNWFGFGLINAEAAVTLAKSYTFPLGTLVTTEDPKTLQSLYTKTSLSLAIPDNSSTGVTSQIYMRHNLKAEAVQVTLSIDHTVSSDLGVELTSPSGTKSILMNINSGISTGNLSNVTLESNAFYGESTMGNWTLKVIDGANADTGTLKSWSIIAWGAKVTNTGDSTPPSPVSGLGGPSYFMSLSASPKFTWNASGSGDVLRYEHCVGTSASNCSLYGWAGNSTTTSAQVGGMTLTVGNTYFFNVRSVDTSENVSTVVSQSWINDDGGTWTSTSTSGAPSAKTDARAVWTGTDALVFGGFTSTFSYETTRFNPTTDTWTARATMPTYLYETPTPIWTGTEVLVRGAQFNDYVRIYNPSTNAWSQGTSTGAPTNRYGESFVWTGTLGIVWGGDSSNSGSRYNRSGNTWSATTTTGAPSGRKYHAALWSGSHMLIWGGETSSGVYTNTGSKYDPTGNSWTPMSAVNAPSARKNVAAVWTGSEMIVWGGSAGQTDGARYNPTTNTWTAISSIGAPTGCDEMFDPIQAAWSGSKMFVAGCNSGYGAMYDLTNDTWQLIKPPASANPIYGHILIWAGDRLLLWGGWNSINLNTGATYVP